MSCPHLAAGRRRRGHPCRCLSVPEDVCHFACVVAIKSFFFAERSVSLVAYSEARPVYCRLEGCLYQGDAVESFSDMKIVSPSLCSLFGSLTFLSF